MKEWVKLVGAGIVSAVVVIVVALVWSRASDGGLVHAFGGATQSDVASESAKHPGPPGPQGPTGPRGPAGPPGVAADAPAPAAASTAAPPSPAPPAATAGSAAPPEPPLPTVLRSRTPRRPLSWQPYAGGENFQLDCEYRFRLVTPAAGPAAGGIDLSPLLAATTYLYPSVVTRHQMQASAVVNRTPVTVTIANVAGGACAPGEARLGSDGNSCFDTEIEQSCP